MPDFTEEGWIWIQPGTSAYPVAMTFAACSSATANDGAIPYGTTIAEAEVVATDADGNVVNDLVDADSDSGSGTEASCTLSYPTTSGDGLYTLEVRLTLNTGAVLVFDAQRVVVGDRSAQAA